MQISFIIKKKRFLVAAACGWLAGCASHEPPGLAQTVDGSFIRAAQTWDLNHDGVVTCDEWRTYALSLFKEADLNHDGKITPDEFSKIAKQDRLFDVADFKYFDVGNHGYITKEDFVDRKNPAFVTLDKGNTCRLTRDQLREVTTASESKGDFKVPEPKN